MLFTPAGEQNPAYKNPSANYFLPCFLPFPEIGTCHSTYCLSKENFFYWQQLFCQYLLMLTEEIAQGKKQGFSN